MEFLGSPISEAYSEDVYSMIMGPHGRTSCRTHKIKADGIRCGFQPLHAFHRRTRLCTSMTLSFLTLYACLGVRRHWPIQRFGTPSRMKRPKLTGIMVMKGLAEKILKGVLIIIGHSNPKLRAPSYVLSDPA